MIRRIIDHSDMRGFTNENILNTDDSIIQEIFSALINNNIFKEI